jgi:hypothetical protein
MSKDVSNILGLGVTDLNWSIYTTASMFYGVCTEQKLEFSKFYE